MLTFVYSLELNVMLLYFVVLFVILFSARLRSEGKVKTHSRMRNTAILYIGFTLILILFYCCALEPHVLKGVWLNERTSAVVLMFKQGKYVKHGVLHPFYELPFPAYDFVVYTISAICNLDPVRPASSLILCIIHSLMLLLPTILLVYLVVVRMIKTSITAFLTMLILVFTPPLSLSGSSGPRYYSMLMLAIVTYLLVKGFFPIIKRKLGNTLIVLLSTISGIIAHPFGVFSIPLTLLLFYITLKVYRKLLMERKPNDLYHPYLRTLSLFSALLAIVRLALPMAVLEPILANIVDFVRQLIMSGTETLYGEAHARIYSRVPTYASFSWSTLLSFGLVHISLAALVPICKKRYRGYVDNILATEEQNALFLSLPFVLAGFTLLFIGFLNFKTTGTFYVVTYSAYFLLIPSFALVSEILRKRTITRCILIIIVLIHIFSAFCDPAINVQVRDKINPEYTIPSIVDFYTARFLTQYTEWHSFEHLIEYGSLPLNALALYREVRLPSELLPLYEIRIMSCKKLISWITLKHTISVILKEKLRENETLVSQLTLNLVFTNNKYFVLL